MTFKAIRVDKTEAGQNVRFVEMDESELMEGDVTVRVTHSTVNYKDGLALSGKSAIPRRFPHGARHRSRGHRRELRRIPAFAAGDEVVLNGFGLGETHFGGYAERARVKGDWLVKLPAGLDARRSDGGRHRRLYRGALRRSRSSGGDDALDGAGVVTGAAGGVGSVAIALLAKAGWTRHRLDGPRRRRPTISRHSAPPKIIERATLSAPGKPLGKERWAAGVDSVGSHTLANVLAQTRYGGADRGLRPRGRHGPARFGRALHLARRAVARRRQRQLPDGAAPRGLGSGSRAISTAPSSRA